MIKEFLARHPSDTDKRALAMHTLYRAVSEASWFAKSKPAELSNLAKLSYDIMTGNGLWQGVNLPLANDTTHPLK